MGRTHSAPVCGKSLRHLAGGLKGVVSERTGSSRVGRACARISRLVWGRRRGGVHRVRSFDIYCMNELVCCHWAIRGPRAPGLCVYVNELACGEGGRSRVHPGQGGDRSRYGYVRATNFCNLLATLFTSMATVRRTSLRRRVFWCRVKPGGGLVMRHAYASLFAYRHKARSVLSNVLRTALLCACLLHRSLPPTFWPLRTTHHASVLCKLCQRDSLGPVSTVYYAHVLRSGIVTRGWVGLSMTDALRTCSTLSTVNGGGEGVTPHIYIYVLRHV